MLDFTSLIKEKLPKSSFSVPQSKPLPGSKQERNSAGGFSHVIDEFKQLERFLILGTTNNNYYSNEKETAILNYDVLKKCLNLDPVRTVELIVNISTNSRAPKNDVAIFALAVCCSYENSNSVLQNEVRQMSYLAIPLVCRIGTHILQFVKDVNAMRGWGNGLKKAVANWYLSQSSKDMAFQVTKYANRHSWTHGDVFRVCHPRTLDEDKNSIIRYCTRGYEDMVKGTTIKRPTGKEYTYPVLTSMEDYLNRVELAKKATNVKDVVNLITDFNLPREVLPTSMLNRPEVWEAMLAKGMPYTALIRNLNKMTAIGLLKPLSSATKTVCSLLTDKVKIKGSRVHPVTILIASSQYGEGKGDKGSLTWSPVPAITSALNEAFLDSFNYIEPSGKNFLLAFDVSGSMSYGNTGVPGLMPRDCCVAVGLSILKSEPWVHCTAFTDKLIKFNLTSKDTMQSASRLMLGLSFGGTDCSQPMLYAMRDKLEVDCFITMTDNETWAGAIHPSKALEQYRMKMGRNAKNIVIGTTATKFSVADPNDFNSLDISGFDSNIPAIISEFAKL